MYKRKKLNLSVKKHFQQWLFIRIMFTIVLWLSVSCGALYYYANQQLSDSFFDVHVTTQSVSEMLIPVIITGAIISIISGVLLALFLPQKIAGPTFRIEEDLKLIRKGDYKKKIQLRQSDPFHDLSNEINKTVAFFVEQLPSSNESPTDEPS